MKLEGGVDEYWNSSRVKRLKDKSEVYQRGRVFDY